MKNNKKYIFLCIAFIASFLLILNIVNSKDLPAKDKLDFLAENILSGGPPKDGIPPIEKPKYVDVESANKFIDKFDVVFLIEDSNEVKIYPQKILVWHEIVNETYNGQKVSLTYCPLTGSTIGYYGKVGSSETTFGTSGKLLNSNLVLYDRESDTLWSQILGLAIKGENKGKTLSAFPVVWTKWKYAKEKYPNAKVLSVKTGYVRSYDRDPYGSYNSTDSYYQKGGTFFPLLNIDNRMNSKEIVIGVRDGNNQLAISKKEIKSKKIINYKIGETPIVLVYDSDLHAVRVYKRKINNKILNFTIRNKYIYDSETNSKWNMQGNAISGKFKGKKLSWVTSFDVFWFAWSGYYPKTKIYK